MKHALCWRCGADRDAHSRLRIPGASKRHRAKLIQVQGWLKSWFEIKVRGTLGADQDDEKEISILGRQVRWTDRGIEFEADPKHRKFIMEYFDFLSSDNF